jgi:hypothetical protein
MTPAMAVMAPIAALAAMTITVDRYTRPRRFMATVPVRFIPGQPMCRHLCCSLITDQAAVTGTTMAVDQDGGVASIISVAMAIGARTVNRAAHFAGGDPVAGMAGIKRDAGR